MLVSQFLGHPVQVSLVMRETGEVKDVFCGWLAEEATNQIIIYHWAKCSADRIENCSWDNPRYLVLNIAPTMKAQYKALSPLQVAAALRQLRIPR